MEEIVKLGRALVEAMQNRPGIAHVAEIYAENAESVEAVSPPGRYVRIAKGRAAIKAKREDWAATHEIHKLDADVPYIHEPLGYITPIEAEQKYEQALKSDKIAA